MKIKLFLNLFTLAAMLISSSAYAVQGHVALILDNGTFDQFALSYLSNLNGPSHHTQPESLLFFTDELPSKDITHVFAHIITLTKPGCSCTIESDVNPNGSWQNSKFTNVGGTLCSGGDYDGNISVNFKADISKCN